MPWILGDVVSVDFYSIFQLWQERKRSNGSVQSTSGGWMDQPLSLLVQLYTMDVVYQTVEYSLAKDADFSKFTRMQREILAWLEQEL